MSAIDLDAMLRKLIAADIDAVCLGEDYSFDLTLMAATAKDAIVAQWAVMFVLRNPLLGQPPLTNLSVIPGPSPARKDVTTAVTGAVEELRKLRSQILAQANGH